jgi:hypothetical protein
LTLAWQTLLPWKVLSLCLREFLQPKRLEP